MAIYKSKFTGAQVDSILSSVSTKQDKLTAGTGISITNNTISVTLDATLYEVVSSLPTSGQKSSRIYLVPVPSSSGQSVSTDNLYYEYLWVDGKWEKIGQIQTTIDLSSYVRQSDLDSAVLTLDGKIATNKSNIANLKSTTDSHTTQISGLGTRLSTSESQITSLVSKTSPITDDPSYEVVLFKKS